MSILFYSILFYSILFHSQLIHIPSSLPQYETSIAEKHKHAQRL